MGHKEINKNDIDLLYNETIINNEEYIVKGRLVLRKALTNSKKYEYWWLVNGIYYQYSIFSEVK